MNDSTDSQDRIRRIEARLIGLRKNADGHLVSYSFVTEMNQALDALERSGISATEFRPSDTTTVDRYGNEGKLMVEGPYLRAKLDAVIQYLSSERG